MAEFVLTLAGPADERTVAAARRLAAGVAADCGYDLDHVDDVRSAVGELVGVATAVNGEHPVTVTLSTSDSSIRFALATDPGVNLADHTDELGRMILAEATDAYELGPGGANATFSDGAG